MHQLSFDWSWLLSRFRIRQVDDYQQFNRYCYEKTVVRLSSNAAERTNERRNEISTWHRSRRTQYSFRSRLCLLVCFSSPALAFWRLLRRQGTCSLWSMSLMVTTIRVECSHQMWKVQWMQCKPATYFYPRLLYLCSLIGLAPTLWWSHSILVWRLIKRRRPRTLIVSKIRTHASSARLME